MTSPRKILIIRNDKIGDFMLAWPAFSLLKQQYPNTEITALVPKYTASLAEQCKWIDTVLIDTKEKGFLRDIFSLSKKIKFNNFDISISLFSESRTSAALWLAHIPTRVGPATKLAQVFLNRTLVQKRSQSKKPEYEYNLDLIRYLVEINNEDVTGFIKPPFLSFNSEEINSLKEKFKIQHAIDNETKIIFIHPGTGGSAINLSIQQYSDLLITISNKQNIFIVITAGPGELTTAQSLSATLVTVNHHIHESKSTLINFCKYLNISDVFISGSTGPLHIAGALNINTAAFYPARKSATALRWQTLNSFDKRISFSPEKHTDSNDMASIDVTAAANAITNRFF